MKVLKKQNTDNLLLILIYKIICIFLLQVYINFHFVIEVIDIYIRI